MSYHSAKEEDCSYIETLNSPKRGLPISHKTFLNQQSSHKSKMEFLRQTPNCQAKTWKNSDTKNSPSIDHSHVGPSSDHLQRGPPFGNLNIGQSLGHPQIRPPFGNPHGSPPFSNPHGGTPFGNPHGGPPFSNPRGGPPFGNPHGGPPFGNPHGGPPFGNPHGGPPFGNPHGGPPFGNPHGGPPFGNPHGGPPFGNPHGGPPFSNPHGGPPFGNPHGGPPFGNPHGGPPFGNQHGAPPYGNQHSGRPPFGNPCGNPPSSYHKGPPFRHLHGGHNSNNMQGGSPYGAHQSSNIQVCNNQEPQHMRVDQPPPLGNFNQGSVTENSILPSQLLFDPKEKLTTSYIGFGKDKWLAGWLDKIETKSTKKKSIKSKLKLSDVQNKLLNYCSLLRELEDISAILHSLPPNEMGDMEYCSSQLQKRSLEIIEALEAIKALFESSSNVELMKDLVAARRDKRTRKKRSVERRRLQHQKMLVDRANKEKIIDAWLEQAQLAEEIKLRDKKVKQDADNVLSEVRKKQQEAKEIQSIVISLDKLRKVRLKKGEVHGHVTSKEQQDVFSDSAAALSKLVEEQMNQYLLEEKTLRTMMEEFPTTRSTPSEMSKKVGSLKQSLHYILFGEAHVKNFETFRSIESLIKRRGHWDQFIVEDLSSSSVPLGWVLPPCRPSDDWSKFQSES